MTFYLSDEPQLPPANPAPAPNASLVDVAGAAWDTPGIVDDQWAASERVRSEVLREIADVVGDFGADAPADPSLGPEPAYVEYAGRDAGAPWQERVLLRRAAQKRDQDPAAYGDLPFDEASVTAEVNRRRREAWEEDQAVRQMGGFGAPIVDFVVSTVSGGLDETSLATMMVGGPVLGKTAGSVARFIGFEAGMGAAGEAFVLPRQRQVAEDLGIPAPDALEQIAQGALFGAVGGAAIAGIGAAAGRGWSYLHGRAVGEAEVRPDAVDPYDAQADVDAAEEALRDGGAVAAAARPADDFDAVAGKIIGVESGGAATARNPASSATGAGQFIDGTWLAMIRKHRPDLMEGRTEAQVLALRLDPAISREMTAAYARDNAALLAAEGLPTDAGSLYLAHFAGPGTAARVLRGDPGAPVSSVMSAEAIRANRNIRYGGKFLPDFTLGDLRRWAEVKMGQAQDPGTSWRPSTSYGYTQGGEMVTPAGTRIGVDYEIVDASTLIPASGAMQPRDRTRAASDEQIAQIAARLDPARLMPAPETDRGAPLVGPDNVIVSGNGRVRAIQRAAELHPDRLDAYRAAIAEVAPIPEGVEVPVLIARGRGDVDWPQVARESNTSSIARMSASEQAGMEAAAIAPADLDLHVAGRPLVSPENRAFARALLGRLPQAERAGLVDEAGNLNAAGSRRLREALVARAYDAPDLTRVLAEDEGGDLRGIVEALGDAAPSWARLRDEIAAGRVSPELDATAELVEALRIVGRARATARATPGLGVRGALEEALAQVDAFTGPVDRVTRRFVAVYDRPGGPRSQAVVAALLEGYVEGALRVGDVEARLIAETGGATAEEVLDAIIAADPEAFGGARAVAGDAGRGSAPERPEPDDRQSGSGGGGADEPPSGGGGDGPGGEEGPFGPVLTEYAGDPEGAIARLMADKTGEALAVVDRPDLGPIALVYGDRKKGLRHIEVKHPATFALIPDLLRTGRLIADPHGRPRAYLVDESDPANVAAIRLEYEREQKTWLITAFDDVQGSVVARQARSANEQPASASSRIPDATGLAEDTPFGAAVQPPDIRGVDDAAFGAGSASPEVDATNRAAAADLRALIEAEGDFEVATGALVDTPEGKRPEMRSARELLDEIEDQQDLAEVISACTLGGKAGGGADA